MTATVLSVDPSWSGLGWAVCTAAGPLACGAASVSGRWRWERLRAWLDELDAELVEHALSLQPADPPLRLVLEQIPWVYSGAKCPKCKGGPHRSSCTACRGSGRRGGNQAATAYGSGLVSGGLLLHCTGPQWGYPWEVQVRVWRGWWGIRGKREACKLQAIRTVTGLWPTALAGFSETDRRRAEGKAAGAAEAILLGVGAARHIQDAPTGPKRKTRMKL